MMTYNVIRRTLAFLLVIIYGSAYAQTIAEKKAGVTTQGTDLSQDTHRFLTQVNKEIQETQDELKVLYGEVEDLYARGAQPEEYKTLLDKINKVRENLDLLESSWRETAVAGTASDEAYGLWHQPDTTIGQLIIDYGSNNFVYILSPEISSIKLSVDSNLPIPRAAWDDMLELILSQNGIGIRQLNPYLRQLFFLKQDRSNIRLITNKRQDLEIFPSDIRIVFVLTPEPSEVRRVWFFLDKFVNPNSTVVQMIGRDIFIVGQVSEIQDLLKLYDFVSANKGDKEYKVIPVFRVDAVDMAKIVSAIFDQFEEQPKVMEQAPKPGDKRGGAAPADNRSFGGKDEYNGLKIIPLEKIAQAVFLVGTKEEIRKAEEVIRQVENQVGEAREKVIYWYSTKHSDPEELADVLERIYYLMVSTGTGFVRQGPPFRPPEESEPGPPRIAQAPGMEIPPPMMEVSPFVSPEAQTIPLLPVKLYENSFYQQGGYVVNPAPVVPGLDKPRMPNRNRMNFIVDLKTSSIVMVVEAEILPKIKELIRKMDIPKKQVQIECMLFEKRLTRQNQYGLNLLRIGDCASNTQGGCVRWNDLAIGPPNNPKGFERLGVLQFLFSGKKHSGIPAYDLAYRFLIFQEDVQINSAPSVVTTNQTPATIALVEERSINTGIFNVQTTGGTTLENAFTRAQYGTTIKVTPIIHYKDDKEPWEDCIDYVTLETDITFDNILGDQSSTNTQPVVARRHITNTVSIPEGQSVIIGGLRAKTTDDTKDAIPYLGEVPGLGKLFSNTSLSSTETEMFVFITPKIIADPIDDFARLRYEDLQKRPGDIPEFLCRLVEALNWERDAILQGTMTILFGREPDRCICEMGEYDGR